jgi:hypothetical protein
MAERRRRDRRQRLNGGVAPSSEERSTAPHLPPSLLPNGNGLLAASASTGSSESELDWDSDGGEWGGNGLRHPLLSLQVLTKGPPAKLVVSPQKLSFLQMFGLTTLARRNGEYKE